jgi:hypothetical protein
MIKTKKILLALGLCNLLALPVFAQGTAFTYQGRLNSGANLASGSYDLQFTLFTNSSGGTAVAGPMVNTATPVSNGLFTVTVDFGSAFTGTSNWLELAVRTNGAASFSPPLTPRQQVTPTPYAITSANLSGSLPTAQLTGTIAPANIANGTITSNLLAAGSVGSTQLAPNIGIWNQAGPILSYDGGNVGIGVSNPTDVLDVTLGGIIGNNTTSVTEHDPSNRGTKVSFGYKDANSQDFNGMSAVVDPGLQGCGNSGDVLFYTWQCDTATTREVMRINGFGFVGIGNTNPIFPLQVNGEVAATSFAGSGNDLTGVALLGSGNTFSTDQTVNGQVVAGGASAALTVQDRFHPANGFGWQWVSDNTGLNASRVDGGGPTERFTITTNGNVGIGTSTPNSDSSLQVKGLVRMGSETGTSEAPTRSILIRRINSTSSAVGQIVARGLTFGGNVITLERDGTPGGLVLKAGPVAGDAQIVGFGINTSNTMVPFQNIFYGAASASVQVFTDAQKISYLRLSFGDAFNPADFTTVEMMRFVDNLGNNSGNWIGTVTSTVNQ